MDKTLLTICTVVIAYLIFSIVSLEQAVRYMDKTHIKREVHEQLLKANDKAWKKALITDELKGMR